MRLSSALLFALVLPALAEPPEPREVATLPENANVMSLAVSPDGTLIAAGATDYKAYVIDAKTGKTLQVLETRNGHVDALAFSPDGTRLAVGANAILFIYETHDWLLYRTVDWAHGPFRTLEFSRDAQRIAAFTFFGKAGLWNAQTGEDLIQARGHEGFAVRFVVDRTIVASVDPRHRVVVWDKPTGEPLLELEPLKGKETPPGGISRASVLPAGAFSPDGRTFVEWDPEDHKVRFWDMAGDKGPVKRELPESAEWADWRGGPDLLFAFSPDGKYLAAEVGHESDGKVVLWKVEDGKEILNAAGRVPGFLYGGSTFAVAGQDRVRLYAVETGKEFASLTGHVGRVRAYASSPDGKTIYAGGDDRRILEHPAEQGR